MISEAARADIARHAAEARPAEACGFLVGRGDEVVRVVRAQNRAGQARRRFEIHARELLELEDSLAPGEAVVGLYHSHPDGPADPSDADLRLARAWPGWRFLIVGGGGEVFVLQGGGEPRARGGALLSSAGS